MKILIFTQSISHVCAGAAQNRFDQRRIRLADIDGSGVTDVIYLKSDGINLYFNQSGNSWSEARQLNHFPITNNFSSIVVADLLGNGTACLVWSSSLPGHSKRPMRYLKLMEQKPHLLTVTRNNIGGETRVQYAASTKFYRFDLNQHFTNPMAPPPLAGVH